MGDTGEKVIPVKVAVRARPLLKWELDDGCKDCVAFINEAKQVIVNNNKAFTYDYVFDSKVEQEIVYQKAVSPIINGIFKGYNGTILAYGQTGSGKTYTMGSAHCVSEVGVADEITGIIPRVVHDIFKGIEEKSSNYEFLVKVSYVEIYKEDVKDLLTTNSRNQNLVIRENIDGSIRIVGLTEALVSSVVDTLEYMERGNRSRTTASTAMNATSSRSHAIFTIVLEARSITSPDEITCSKFHLVDLAGSERVKRTKAEGNRLQEGIKINAGLLALGNVISALGDGQPGQHIPYRVSKLTRLLQDSLGGNSLTVMIACISPADSNAEETINTLRYADRARKIKNKAVVNRDPHTAELVSLRKEVQQLRLQLLQANGPAQPVVTVKDTSQTREQLRKLEEENRNLLQEIEKLVETNAEMCEKAVTTDVHLDKLESKLMELQSDAMNVASDPHDLSLLEQAVEDDSHHECMRRLRHLRAKLLDVEVIAKETAEDTVANLAITLQVAESNESVEDADATETEEETAAKAEHILRTAKLSNQLQELTKALAMKEQLAKRMCASGENMVELRSQYEDKLKKLDKDLNELQNERDSLAAALKVAQSSNECKKLSEKRRVRLGELENQIKMLKQEKKEKEKMAKLKLQSDHKVATLHNEIQSMKSHKVKLMRQIKEENVKFQSWKKEKEREVKQLKEKNRKRQFELVKLERDFNNQKTVLRRKTEEAAASNRRLKEALMKQRITADKRTQTHSKMLDSANSRMKVWMEEDIEIAVSAKAAKNHLTSLEEELRSLNEQLSVIESAQSPSKRRRTFNVNDMNETQRRELLNECELKEVQIKELQSKLSDAREARNRQHTRLLQITSIAEARSAMKHLFNLVVDNRLAEEACRAEATQLHNDVRVSRAEAHRLTQAVEEAAASEEEEISRIHSAHQDQILFLTKQLNEASSGNKDSKSSSEREEELSSQIRIQANLIEQLLKEKEEREKSKQELNSDSINQKKPIKKPKITRRVELEELIEEEEDFEIVSDYDSDYVPTPRFNRSKRRTTLLKEKNEAPELFCACSKSRCSTKLCKCRKAGSACNDRCRCENCRNATQSGEADSTVSNVGSNENSVVDDSNVGETTADKENETIAPYYKRMSTLLGAESPDEVEKSLVSHPSTSRGSIYKPCYFNSPLTDRLSGSKKHQQGVASPSGKLNFVKPKATAPKRRRLHANSGDLFSQIGSPL